jgi:hypothetical protein
MFLHDTAQSKSGLVVRDGWAPSRHSPAGRILPGLDATQKMAQEGTARPFLY